MNEQNNSENTQNKPFKNVWLIASKYVSHHSDYKFFFPKPETGYPVFIEGDIIVFRNEQKIITKVSQLYKVIFSEFGLNLIFDKVVNLTSNFLDEENQLKAKADEPWQRIDLELYKKLIKENNLPDIDAQKLVDGSTPQENSFLRELLTDSVYSDLLGPANGVEEEIRDMNVQSRYLLGKLAPRETAIEQVDVEEFNTETGRVSPDDNDHDEVAQENTASTNQSLVPSSFGITFCIEGSVEELEVEALWGHYTREESESYINEETGNPIRVWKRSQAGGRFPLKVAEGAIEPIAPDPEQSDVVITGTIRPQIESGDRLITLFLVNNQEKPDQNQDEAWLFQPCIKVKSKDNSEIFRRKPVLGSGGHDFEREALEMIYRDHVEFATGHGVSVRVFNNDDPEKAYQVQTEIIPSYEIPVTETPGLNPNDRPVMKNLISSGFFDMRNQASWDKDKIIQGLSTFIDDYDAWINELDQKLKADLKEYSDTGNDAISNCKEISERLKEGVKTLSESDNALEAYRFSNSSMADQRIRSIFSLQKRRGITKEVKEYDIPKNRTWRPFQLAFMLLSIPSLSDPKHKDRTQPLEAFADLLWFPTGGGKTEAYLGVAAFAMGIRRLQNDIPNYDSSRGLTVIMRYTLRLLTLQQFQRATTLICAMEQIRKSDISKWGDSPFSIGLWVGERVTPNTTDSSHDAIVQERESNYSTGSTPAQLTNCPWCGSEIKASRDIYVDKVTKKTITYCSDKFGQCEFTKAKAFNSGIPVITVDEELYRRPPSLLIATVDKFAMMAWKGAIRNLFGRTNTECPRHGLLWPEADCTGRHQRKGDHPRTEVQNITAIRPPDLIIQDEFHLISGPLGTMVGLYESAVDELSSWDIDGVTVRPKIIASTATVRRAAEQVNNVFMRKVSIFPPSGLDVSDNFFSVQRSTDEKPGRKYIGICSPGSSRPAVLIRVYVALLTAAQELFNHFGPAVDPYMTLVGYFNSLRELGGMRRLAEDDVQTRAYRVQMSNVDRPGLAQRITKYVDELTSRVSSKDIPKKLDHLEIPFKQSYEKGEIKPIDIVLATNMLSVGVDVNRLGLMVVNGQPKSTAEYIQATSRVGRSFPGLVFTVLTWARPRDLSHYETFEHYHSTFYKHVEAQSVTPYAPRALDRGLTGSMISLLRSTYPNYNPNMGAEELKDINSPEVTDIKEKLSSRTWKVSGATDSRDRVNSMLSDRFDRWKSEVDRQGRRLGYQPEHRQGDIAALLKKPGVQAWDEFTAPMSMREVEPGVSLIMDMARIGQQPQWQHRSNDSEGDTQDE